MLGISAVINENALLSVFSAILLLSQLDAELDNVGLSVILSCHDTHDTRADTIQGRLGI